MGRLAKTGIVRGKRVPVEGLVTSSDGPVLDEFSRKCLGSFGFARIADKVLHGSDLTVDEIDILIAKASVPVLMKLTQIKQPEEVELHAVPVTMLPLESWLDHDHPDTVCRRAIEHLQSIPYSDLRVVIELNDFSDLEHLWPEILTEIKKSRSDVTLIEFVKFPGKKRRC